MDFKKCPVSRCCCFVFFSSSPCHWLWLTHRRCPKQAKRQWLWTLPQPTPWEVASGATGFCAWMCLAFSLRPWVRVWNWRDTTMAETEHVWIVFHSCEFPSGFTSILKRTTFPMIINDSMIPFFGVGENYVGHPGFQPRWWAVVDMRLRNPVASPAPYWRPCRKLNGCEAETSTEWGIQVECMGI
jgi:hypothetical protein